MSDKRRLQDVIPPRENRRPQRTARREQPAAESLSEKEEPTQRSTRPPQGPPPNRRVDRGKRPRRWGRWLVALVVLIALVFGLSFLFSDSRVTVVPKNRQVTIDGTFEALRDPAAGQLGFEVMSIEREVTRTVPASGEEEVEERARGTIVVYNDHSSANQRLIKDTRFETPDGLIYRTPEAITVPGQETVDGEVIPGSIEVEVVADQPGEEYNIGLTDFTVPGFSGSPRFETFYARSKTPMTGGFDGTRKIVRDADRQQAVSDMRDELRSALVDAAQAQKPSGFLLYDDALFIDFESLPDESGDGGEAILRQKGTLHGVLLDASQLAALVAENTVAGYEGGEVRLEAPKNLAFSVLEKNAVRPTEDEVINFSLSGGGRLIWEFDTESLKQDLAGVPKEALPTVLSGYPSIESAEAVLRPLWRGTFPEVPGDISVVENLDS